MKVLRRKFKYNEFGELLKDSEVRIVEEIDVPDEVSLLQFERSMANIEGKKVYVRYEFGRFSEIVIFDRKNREHEYVSILKK